MKQYLKHEIKNVKKYKDDSTEFWETYGCKLSFEKKLLAFIYYKVAPVTPSEALVERFYSITGFIWDNRRYNLNSHNVLCVTMKHLIWKVSQEDDESHEGV